MINGSSYTVTGPPVSTVSDPAPIRSDAFPTGGDRPSELTDGAPDVMTLERLAERVAGIAAQLEALVDAVTPLIQDRAANEDTAGEVPVAEGIEAAVQALIYADFFREAVGLGMAPDMVADAYRLADLTAASVDLRTREVSGVKQAIDALLEKKPYLFFVHQGDVGLETNPARVSSSVPDQVDSLAKTLGVSPEFAAELVKKRSEKAGASAVLSDIWRMPRANRLSYLETND
jgi:hypothetical protein